MYARIVRFMLVIAMLFGAVGSPAFAAKLSNVSQQPSVAVTVAVPCQDGDSNDPQCPVNSAGEHHHHCAHGIAIIAPSFGRSIVLAGSRFFAARPSALTPTSQAPPTQPPSA